ncbi:hypothetical protein AXX16_1454 [Serratia rubidaea]|nr:hypothetical protein AXX16_1454 [Serratia rubidaea]
MFQKRYDKVHILQVQHLFKAAVRHCRLQHTATHNLFSDIELKCALL